jgi:hypothetical protein
VAYESPIRPLNVAQIWLLTGFPARIEAELDERRVFLRVRTPHDRPVAEAVAEKVSNERHKRDAAAIVCDRGLPSIFSFHVL